MKKITLLVFVCLIFGTIKLKAQWDTLATFNNTIHDLQKFGGSLFVGGNFTKNGASTCYWSTSYNGTSFTNHTTLIGGGGIKQMAEFNGELYAVGAMQHGSNLGISVWDGYTWNNASTSTKSNGVIYADGNDLYAADDFGLIRKKSGTGSFATFYDFGTSGTVTAIIRYKTNLIISGSFTSVNGVAARNIAAWNGTSWSALGSGLSKGAAAMEVFNNELYVGGKMDTAGGVAVKYMAKWNGTSWSGVGGGITGVTYNGILDMIVYNGSLYVGGDFTQIGGVNANNAASWNGSVWKSMGVPASNSVITNIDIYNGQFYASVYDGTYYLMRLKGYVGIEEKNLAGNFSLYPNPTNGRFTIGDQGMIHSSLKQLEILNEMGESLLFVGNPAPLQVIDLGLFAPGIYYVRLETDKGMVIKEVLLQR